MPMFSHTVEETRAWLSDLGAIEPALADDRRAYAALRAVLHAIRDRMSVAESADFAAQLPTLLRGVYFESWHPALAADDLPAFHDTLRDHLGGHPDIAVEPAARAVLALLFRRLGRAGLTYVIPRLPKDLQAAAMLPDIMRGGRGQPD